MLLLVDVPTKEQRCRRDVRRKIIIIFRFFPALPSHNIDAGHSSGEIIRLYHWIDSFPSHQALAWWPAHLTSCEEMNLKRTVSKICQKLENISLHPIIVLHTASISCKSAAPLFNFSTAARESE